MPTDEEAVTAAAEAAQRVVFDRYGQSEVTDLDITVSFEDGVLEVDVYLNAPDDEKAQRAADDAALAARSAVDDLFEGEA